MKLGFDKEKVTCFKCRQKGHFKREYYYKKAIYHHNNEQPSRTNQNQIEEGSSREKKQAYVMIQDDEGFNLDKYIEEEKKEKKVLVAEFKESREENHARRYLSDVYKAFTEARWVNRWSEEKECFIDPKENPIVDPKKVDFKALVAAIPTVGVWCKGLEEILNYRQKVDEGIKKVIYASLEKKKMTVEEIVDESKKMKEEILKKATNKTPEEDQIEVTIQTETNKSSDTAKSTDKIDEIENKTDQQCRKCMETCSACTEKDRNLRSRDI
ncbi:putative transcription factor interactor and regulator CCHC(Zn) family [Helianthus anomalus]